MLTSIVKYSMGFEWKSDSSTKLNLHSTIISLVITHLLLVAIPPEVCARDLEPSTSIKAPVTDNNDIADGCEACKLLVKSFDGGLERTMRGKHEGGDTHWEEKNLMSYADSEIRLVEIQEDLCDELSKGKVQCLSIAEEAEQDIEEWWFKQKNKGVRLHDFLCISKLKKCCPEHTFGPTCSRCPSDCSKHGLCDGSGTRSGTGECACQSGYTGPECADCEEGFYRMRTDTDEKFTCLKCDKACKSTCDGPISANCTECKSGYARDAKTNLCVDINECELGPHGMSLDTDKLCPAGTFCINTDGHYKCSECHRVCSTCLGYGRSKCITCAPITEMNSEHQCVHFSELEGDESDSLLNVVAPLVNPLLLLFMLVLVRTARRVYDNLTGRPDRQIFGRLELVMVNCYLILYFCRTRYFKQLIGKVTQAGEPRTEDEDFLSKQATLAEEMAEL